MAWLDEAKKRSKQLMDGSMEPGQTTYALFRGLDDQLWTFERLEEISELLRRGKDAEHFDKHVEEWLGRVEQGPTIDRAGGDWRKEG